MKRTNDPPRSARTSTWVLAALGLAACTPAPRWIAVTGGDDYAIVLFDADLTKADTIRPAVPDRSARRIVNALFASDGSSIYLTDIGARTASASLHRVRREDGHTMDRWDFPPARVPRTIGLLPDSRTLVLTDVTTATGTPGVVRLLSADPLQERAVLEPCRTEPLSVAALRDHRAFTRCADSTETLAELDYEVGWVVKSIPFGESDEVAGERCGPGDVALTRTGTILLTTCSESGSLVYADRLTLQLIDSVVVGQGIFHMAVTLRGAKALVTVPLQNEVVLVDLRARVVVARTRTPPGLSALAVSGDGRSAYVVAAGNGSSSGTLLKLSLADATIQASVPVPAGARSLTLWPGDRSPVLYWR